MRRWIFRVIVPFALWLSVSGQAFAELALPSSRDGARLVNVTLESGDPKVRLAVLPEYPPEDPDLDPPIKVCEGQCSLGLPPGSYRLEISGPTNSDVRSGTTTFTIDADSEIKVEAASKRNRSGGLGLGITGASLATAATAFTLLALFINSAAECLENCQDDTQENRDRHALKIMEVGGAVILGGVVISTIGWILFAHNSGPKVTVGPTKQKATALDGLRLGPVRMHAGWGIGGELRF